MYWAVRHFIYEIHKKVDYWKTMAISSTAAFLYAVMPTAYYFSRWSNYVLVVGQITQVFYVFLPALIAGVDSLVAYKINVKTTLLLVFVVAGQLTFSLPYILSGNYLRLLQPNSDTSELHRGSKVPRKSRNRQRD
ncbi:MAG: hypothetical protein ASUL_02294 [Candidatus Aramenus sulfurataquae]|jgi:ABC-type spermidine/putrescine transport system permease subunit II|uniref:Uncharacterized protein n=1 Tax=Candidatus Aramenus sulfurataquae TaxID=1326980 RepID=W7KX16_9CREN|nr:MAG: hypothetical protein ASUL_02294 [Candidatus Aramenus sulfurataquae]